MRLHFDELSADSFQRLVYRICLHILGASTETFAHGPDGGRDAVFEGKALQFDDWNGIIIIQAKHVDSPCASFSTPDFFSEKSGCLIKDEVKKIKKLRNAGKLDYYMLFANRRKSAGASDKIKDYISKEVGIPRSHIYLADIDVLNDYCRKFPDVKEDLLFPEYGRALEVAPEELEGVVEELAKYIKLGKRLIQKKKIIRVPFKKKNEINHLSESQARWLYETTVEHDDKIRKSLAYPANAKLQEQYDEAVSELQRKVLEHDKDADYDFYKLFNYMLDSLFKHSEYLNTRKRLTKIILGFMYFNCDIGRTP